MYPRSAEKGKGGKPKKSITDLGFFGMWKDRDDIGTGAEYVARIRGYRETQEP